VLLVAAGAAKVKPLLRIPHRRSQVLITLHVER
jgi:hypothetical protein